MESSLLSSSQKYEWLLEMRVIMLESTQHGGRKGGKEDVAHQERRRKIENKREKNTTM